MKTEKRQAYIGVGSILGVGIGYVFISFDKPESNEYQIKTEICEVTVEVPVLSDTDMDKLLCGEEVASLEELKKKTMYEASEKTAMIDARIQELRCIEFKP